MSNLSTFRIPSLKSATGSLTYSANTGVVTYVAPLKLSQLTNDIGALTGNASIYNSNNTIVQRTFDGRVEASSLRLLGSAVEGNNAAIEIGNLTTPTLAYIDFHSSGYNNDYDVRIAASGGANGTSSAGTLNVYSAQTSFYSSVSVNPSLSLLNSNSSCLVYTDVNSNNFVIRSGPSGAYKYASLSASGDLSINNGGLFANGNISGISGFYSGDLHAYRAGTTPTAGYYYAGNANNAYYGFDGSNAYIRPGSSGVIYRNTDSANFPVFDSCSLWGTTRSWYGTTSAVLGATPTSQNPALNLGCANTGMGSSTGGYGALRIQSYDNTSTSGAFMEFLNQNRYGAYLGLDSDNQLKFGGWSAGANAYRIHHFGNCNPIIDMRMIFAGDQTGASINQNVGGNIWEPYAGAAISGVATANVGGTYVLVNARWRYVQKQDAYGNWYTVAYG